MPQFEPCFIHWQTNVNQAEYNVLLATLDEIYCDEISYDYWRQDSYYFKDGSSIVVDLDDTIIFVYGANDDPYLYATNVYEFHLVRSEIA